MMPMRDIFAIVFTAFLAVALVATGYVMLDHHYSARDMTDLSAHRRHYNLPDLPAD